MDSTTPFPTSPKSAFLSNHNLWPFWMDLLPILADLYLLKKLHEDTPELHFQPQSAFVAQEMLIISN